MRFPTVVVLALTMLLCLSLGGAVVTATDSPTHDRPSQSLVVTNDTAPPPQLSPASPSQVIHLSPTPEGHAEWTLESHFRLESDDDVETFGSFADAVAAGETELEFEPGAYEPFVALAAESTEREMALENASWNEPRLESPEELTTATDNDSVQIGIVSATVTWTNFTEVDGNRIYLGDALLFLLVLVGALTFLGGSALPNSRTQGGERTKHKRSHSTDPSDGPTIPRRLVLAEIHHQNLLGRNRALRSAEQDIESLIMEHETLLSQPFIATPAPADNNVRGAHAPAR